MNWDQLLNSTAEELSNQVILQAQSELMGTISSPLSPASDLSSIPDPESDNETQKKSLEGVLLPGRKRPIPFQQINQKDRSGRTVIFKYSSKGDLESTTALLKAGASLSISDYAGWTPLHEACLEGHADIVELMLVYGADVNARGGDGDTPLHDAVGNRHAQVVQILLRHGASFDAHNEHGQTPLEFAIQQLNESDPDDLPASQAIVSILQDWQTMQERMSIRNEFGETLLHLACKEGDLDKINDLLWYGHDINCVDNSGLTPLHNACLNGHFKVVDKLLAFGSKFDIQSIQGHQPLEDACSNGHVSIVKLLLEYGAETIQPKYDEKINLLLEQPRDSWKPFKEPEYKPRNLQMQLSPQRRKNSDHSEDSNPQIPYPFAWGGLDPKAGPFESSREEKKFKALMKTLAKQDQDKRKIRESSAENEKNKKLELKKKFMPKKEIKKKKIVTQTITQNSQDPELAQLFFGQSVESLKETVKEPKKDIVREQPKKETKEPKKDTFKEQKETPKEPVVQEKEDNPLKREFSQVSILSEDNPAKKKKKKSWLGISGYKRAGEDEEDQGESVEPQSTVEEEPQMDMEADISMDASFDASIEESVPMETEPIVQKENRPVIKKEANLTKELKSRLCLPLLGFKMEDEFYCLDLQLALFFGLKSARQLLDKFPVLNKRVLTQEQKRVLEKSHVSSVLLQSMLFNGINRRWLPIQENEDSETLLLSAVDLTLIPLGQIYFMDQFVYRLEETTGAQVWKGCIEFYDFQDQVSPMEVDYHPVKRNYYVHKLKRK